MRVVVNLICLAIPICLFGRKVAVPPPFPPPSEDLVQDKAPEYMSVAVNLLHFFAKNGDAVVRIYMAKACNDSRQTSLIFSLRTEIFQRAEWPRVPLF